MASEFDQPPPAKPSGQRDASVVDASRADHGLDREPAWAASPAEGTVTETDGGEHIDGGDLVLHASGDTTVVPPPPPPPPPPTTRPVTFAYPDRPAPPAPRILLPVPLSPAVPPTPAELVAAVSKAPLELTVGRPPADATDDDIPLVALPAGQDDPDEIARELVGVGARRTERQLAGSGWRSWTAHALGLLMVAAALVVVNSTTGSADSTSGAGADGCPPTMPASRANVELLEVPGLASGTACLDSDDVYAVELAGGRTIRVDATFEHDGGDIDLVLVDDVGKIVTAASSDDDGETLVATVDSGGTYLVVVQLLTDDTHPGNSYGLTSALTTAGGCVDDEYEDNDAQAGATALPIPASGVARVCAADPDYYRFDLDRGDVVAIDVAFSTTAGDVDLALIDEAGEVLSSSFGTDDSEGFTYRAPASGSYYLLVDAGLAEGSDPTRPVEYSFQLEVGSRVACTDDELEENDDVATPSRIELPAELDASACRGDVDVFELDVRAGDVIAVDAAHDTDLGELDLVLYGPDGGYLGEAGGSNGLLTMTVLAEAAGSYQLWVESFGDDGRMTGVDYHLAVATNTRPACPADALEDNDDLGTASEVTLPAVVEAWSCPVDPDLYRFDATAGETIDVAVRFARGDGDLDIVVYGPDEGVLARGSTTGEHETLTFPAELTGSYAVLVSLAGEEDPVPGVRYEIEISRLDG